MATSSIFNNIRVKDGVSCHSLLNAMEAAEKAAEGRNRKQVKIKELKSKEDAKEFFSN